MIGPSNVNTRMYVYLPNFIWNIVCLIYCLEDLHIYQWQLKTDVIESYNDVSTAYVAINRKWNVCHPFVDDSTNRHLIGWIPGFVLIW